MEKLNKVFNENNKKKEILDQRLREKVLYS